MAALFEKCVRGAVGTTPRARVVPPKGDHNIFVARGATFLGDALDGEKIFFKNVLGCQAAIWGPGPAGGGGEREERGKDGGVGRGGERGRERGRCRVDDVDDIVFFLRSPSIACLKPKGTRPGLRLAASART